jgi:tripartite-type tricarboxylate transporter receptor subunit TctC
MKRILQGAAGLSVALGLLLAVLPAAAQTQKYPSRPIKMIVPVPPGSGTDLIARAIGQKMSERMGVPVIVENRPGASAAIGTDALAKSPADGYTIMTGYTVHATNPIFNSKLPYDTLRDTAPIVYLCYIPLVLDVHPSVPVNSVQELIDLARSQPGRLSYASGGAGAGAHLSGELFRILTKTDVVHIPYKGNAPALADLLGGQVHMMFDIVTTSLPHIRAGKLRGLAVTSARRSSLAPELPTMIEAGLPGFEVVGWYMLFAPAGTPKEIMAVLNAEANRAIKDPEVGAKLGSQGVEWVGGTTEQADAFLRSEMARWGKIARETGMKAD